MPTSPLIPLSLLKPSKTNPRTHFDETMLAELAANITKHGLFQPLIVRPNWCQGCHSDAELQQAKTDLAVTDGCFAFAEIVDGERRFRAAKIAGLTELPCDVREMTDTTVIEVQLITFLQKESLLPLEESKGFQQLLGLKDAAGEPMHTAATIAASVGKKENYVYERLKLAELPAEARSALEAGKIGTKVAVLLARIPGKDMRAAATKAVLHDRGEPMSVRDTAAYVNEHCMTELKGAPFDLADAELEPVAGPCTTCPHRTGNNRELFGDVKRGDICTQPECFHRKCDAVWAVTAAARSGEDNVKVLPVAEHAAFFSPWGDAKELVYNSEYVDINQKPALSLLKQEVIETKTPKWRDMLDGPKIFLKTVPITIVRDGHNRLRELTLRKLAVAGAIENGETIFATGAGQRGNSNPRGAQERKSEMEKHKKAQAIGFAATKAVRDAIAKKGLYDGLWDILLELALGHAGHDGTWYIAKRDGLKGKASANTDDLVRESLGALKSESEKLAAITELLYMRAIRHSGIDHVEEFKSAAKLYEVDLPAIKAAVSSKSKAAKAKAPKSAAAKAVKAVKASKPRKGGAK